MALEIKTTGAADYGQHMKVLVCGPAGAGKTLISSTFPNSIFASAEGGLMSVARRNVSYVEIDHPSDLKQLLSHLDQDDAVREKFFKRPIETVVIDTIDEIQKLLVKERLGTKKLEQLDMQGWGWLGDQMREILRNFRNLPLNVVFTCHLKETSDQNTGQVFYKPALQGAVGDEVANYMDLSLLLRTRLKTKVSDDGKTSESYQERFLQTYKDGQHDWIKDRSGQLPQEFPVNFEDDYQRMYDLIFGNAPKIQPEPFSTEPPTEIPVEVEKMIDKAAGLKEVKGGATTPVPIGKDKDAPKAEFKCEECGDIFTDENQRDLSVAILRRVLDSKCYDTETKKAK